ncbi:MAG: hypothetical protein PHF86_13415 [Candidatus Nanoarchaeia archaeon]|nr:hypothetical protein [Candidatus Nanoarchaeia archaeon]
MEKVGELKKHIYLCNSHEERLLNELEALNVRRKLNLVTKKQYKKQVTSLLKGRSVEDWISYYKDYKGDCFKIIDEHKKDLQFRTFMFIALLFLLVFPFGMNFTGYVVKDDNKIIVNQIVSLNAYLSVDGIAMPIPLEPEFYNGEYVYNIKSLDKPLNAKKIEIIDNNLIVFSQELK